tara:strand:+ start:70 stop:702 length:633 start_codon:yes stop_codon:yes gene_type:complete
VPFEANGRDFGRSQISAACEVLKKGGVVVTPTDTLYGLGADAFNPLAVARVFRIKGRSLNLPLPVFLDSYEALPLVTGQISDLAWKLGKMFWPGGLTLVVPKSEAVPSILTSSGSTLGVRVPDHEIPRALVQQLGRPITGTSANVSGEPDIVSSSEIQLKLGQEVDMILEGELPNPPLPSTVVDLTGEVPKVVRLGAVSLSELSEYFSVE